MRVLGISFLVSEVFSGEGNVILFDRNSGDLRIFVLFFVGNFGKKLVGRAFYV